MDEKFYERMYQANIKLSDENTLLKNDVKILERRIEDAIEYMDRRDLDWGSDEHQTLMNILKGEDD